nr:MAG TPA: hypothetical protein [Caudoviricetes sp.]
MYETILSNPKRKSTLDMKYFSSKIRASKQEE